MEFLFLPADLKVDALEVSRKTQITGFRTKHPELVTKKMISASDAHYLEDIGSCCTLFEMEKISFQEIRMTMAGINGRKFSVE